MGSVCYREEEVYLGHLDGHLRVLMCVYLCVSPTLLHLASKMPIDFSFNLLVHLDQPPYRLVTLVNVHAIEVR